MEKFAKSAAVAAESKRLAREELNRKRAQLN
jgi:hypothetical protein